MTCLKYTSTYLWNAGEDDETQLGVVVPYRIWKNVKHNVALLYCIVSEKTVIEMQMGLPLTQQREDQV